MPEVRTNSARDVMGRIVPPEQYAPEALQDVFQKMEQEFQLLRSDAEKLIQKEKEKPGEDEIKEMKFLPVALLDEIVKKYSTDLYKFGIRDIGRVQFEDVRDIWPLIKDLGPGDMSRPERISQYIYCYYIEESFEGERRPFEDVRAELEKDLIRSRMENAARDLKNKILQESGLKFTSVLP